MKRIRVVQWGLGAMGAGMVRLMLEKENLQVVGAIGSRKENIGKDLGDVVGVGRKLNIKVADNPKSVLKKSDVDVVLHATKSFVCEIIDELHAAIEAGIPVITIAEEMTFPEVAEPDLAKTIDELAKRHRVAVLGTGINPGFVLDTLIIALSGVCQRVDRIEGSRLNDLSSYSLSFVRALGVGTTPDEFKAGLDQGTIIGHVGFKESIMLISETLGLGVDRIEQIREPIVSKVDREAKHIKIKAGMVAGCRHVAIGYRGSKEVIKLTHPQQIRPDLEKAETGDFIHLHGEPEVKLSITPEISGDKGVVAITVNMIPQVLKATPGIKRMVDLPLPSCLMGNSAFTRRI